MVGSSVNSTMDISRTSDTKNAVQTIANAVDLVYANGPGAKRTLNLYIPLNGMILETNGTDLIMNVPLNSPINGDTSKNVTASINYNVNITNPNFDQGWYTITVNWPVGDDAITISH
jgi:uncharacterized protein (UPF0333 family)